MTDLKLTVIKALEKHRLDTSLSEEERPDHLLLLSAEYRGSIELPEGVSALFITDNPLIAKEVLADAADWLSVVLIGVPEDAETLDGLCELWRSDEPSDYLHKRYVRLVKALKTAFDADFYARALTVAADTVLDMLWFKRSDGIHTLVNKQFCEIVHKSREDVVGKDHFYIWDVPRPAAGSADNSCEESEEAAISSGSTVVFDEPVKTKDGMKQFTTYKTPLYDRFGNLFGTVGVGHDVTNFSNMGLELSILVENLPYPMTIFTSDWKAMKMNRGFVELAGTYSEAQIAAFDYRAWKESALTPVEGEGTENEYEYRSGDEVRRIILSELEILDHFDNVSGYFVTVQDITYQRAYESSIIEAANTDILTGIHNRRFFYSALTGLQGKRFTLLYMDIDRFKAVNDSFGHDAGDDVLIVTSRLIKEMFPGSICCRLGGDEFAVIDDQIPLEELTGRCRVLEEKVLKAFEKYGLGTAISIGIYETDGSAADIDAVIRQGDRKMYEIKKLHHDRLEHK